MNANDLSLPDSLFQILIWIIAIILLLIAGFLFAAVYRRIAQARRYAKLDGLRSRYAPAIRDAIDRGALPEIPPNYAFRPTSLEWIAVEDVLFELADGAGYRNPVNELFLRLGYVAHYEKSLQKRSPIERSLAIDKLGRMQCAASTNKLVPLLSGRNSEIVTNAVRALGRIGSAAALDGILGRMDDLLANGLVSRKMIETSLLNFGKPGIPLLVKAAEAGHDAVARGSLLEVLSRFPAIEGVPVAAHLLDDPNPEIRSKALTLIGVAGTGLAQAHRPRVAALLSDPVWFVRLQAAKTLGAVGDPGVARRLGDNLMDPNWQVRNAAATALTRFGGPAIPVFLSVLEHTDRYAKESVCEEIEKTGFVDLLIANLEDRGSAAYDDSKRILTIMAALNYRTPHVERLKTVVPESVRREIETMIAQERCG